MATDNEGVSSLPIDLLRFVPTLLTIVVLGGAAIFAMGGLKHHAPAASAPAAVVAPAATVEPESDARPHTFVVYLVDSPTVAEALESSHALRDGTPRLSFSVMLVNSPESEAKTMETLSTSAQELTLAGIDFEIIDLRNSAQPKP